MNAIRRRVDYPAAVKNAPILLEEENFYYLAFADLHTCRLYEGGPIPWTAIDIYGAKYFPEADGAEVFEAVIKRIDGWLIDYNAKRNKGNKGGPTSDVSKPGDGLTKIRRHGRKEG